MKWFQMEFLRLKQKNAPIFKDAKELLIKWESGNKEVIDLWSQMNSWVYEGFSGRIKILKFL